MNDSSTVEGDDSSSTILISLFNHPIFRLATLPKILGRKSRDSSFRASPSSPPSWSWFIATEVDARPCHSLVELSLHVSLHLGYLATLHRFSREIERAMELISLGGDRKSRNPAIDRRKGASFIDRFGSKLFFFFFLETLFQFCILLVLQYSVT